MKPKCVVDASLAGAWLLPDESSSQADKLLARVLGEELEMVVPALWDYEMLNLLISAQKRKRLDASMVVEGHALLAQLPRQTMYLSDSLSGERLLKFAEKFRLSSYDAAYLELADRIQCALHTGDRKLADAAEAIGLLG